jgi:uncharacterized membrane protein
MWKRKWFIPVVVVSVLLIGGVVGGVVVAGSDNTTNAEDQSRLADRFQAFLDRVCAIYEEKTGVAIDQQQLKDAVKQAQSEMRDEALEKWLQNLVNKGEITQEEADQYLQWWQSRPEIKLPLPGLGKLARVFQIGVGPCCAPDATP